MQMACSRNALLELAHPREVDELKDEEYPYRRVKESYSYQVSIRSRLRGLQSITLLPFVLPEQSKYELPGVTFNKDKLKSEPIRYSVARAKDVRNESRR